MIVVNPEITVAPCVPVTFPNNKPVKFVADVALVAVVAFPKILIV